MALHDPAPSSRHDWNTPPLKRRAIEIADSTLSDGLQSASVLEPPLRHKRRLLGLMSELGLHCVSLGHPGSSTRHAADALDLAREFVRGQWALDATCDANATVKDVASALEVRERSGLDVEIAIALCASPVRVEAECISLDRVLENADAAIGFAVRAGARVSGVIDDATRTPPDVLAMLLRHLISHGLTSVRLSDSAGHATPDGAAALVRFATDQLRSRGTDRVRLEWRGQNDRGLALSNALMAIDAGADRVLASALGLGERSGTVPMELLLANLQARGQWTRALGLLAEYCDSAATAFGIAVAPQHPVVGRDAFRTVSGSHVSALVKALRAHDRARADGVVSGLAAQRFGMTQQVMVSPMSGLSNVRWWLAEHGYDAADLVLTREMLLAVQQTQRAATDDELRSLADSLIEARRVGRS
jgi:2-isopropylmalate synthase